MDHNHDHLDDVDPMLGMDVDQGSHASHHEHVPNFFEEGTGNELLEMLHMPILHGGVKEVLLLSSLSTASAGSFTVACLVLVVCVALLELLRLLSWWVENVYAGANSMMSSMCGCRQCNSLTVGVGERKNYDAIHDTSLSRGESAATLDAAPSQTSRSRWLSWFCVGGLQFLVYVSSTFLMLIAMTMNIYLIISMAVGSAIGKMAVVCVKKKLMDARK